MEWNIITTLACLAMFSIFFGTVIYAIEGTSRWSELKKRYSYSNKTPVPMHLMQTGYINEMSFRYCLWIGLNNQGMFIRK